MNSSCKGDELDVLWQVVEELSMKVIMKLVKNENGSRVNGKIECLLLPVRGER